MVNPYASPQFESSGDSSLRDSPRPRERGLVGHVRVVSILQMVQGGLDLSAGLLLIGMAVFFGYFLEEIAKENPAMDPQGQLANGGMKAMSIAYGVAGGVIVAIGLLSVVAGAFNLRYRGRVLGFISLTTGLLTVLTCYCAPTSLALFVYGLVVYLNPSVAQAFDLGEAGYTSSQIDDAFPVRR
ncbi:hypothetical protein [Lignipirellula cremea]|uniref:DUF4064 domain-containing protein n=1 Tax=Lignipirellula cremea TaxID=2528010 RepID=A0A518E2W1_9BACT|nr:hypothetical protein [Lignipirellula cremea]QDU98428.1 hypothetical protein Pla8534_62960 [Lignipirellula cremea]